VFSRVKCVCTVSSSYSGSAAWRRLRCSALWHFTVCKRGFRPRDCPQWTCLISTGCDSFYRLPNVSTSTHWSCSVQVYNYSVLSSSTSEVGTLAVAVKFWGGVGRCLLDCTLLALLHVTSRSVKIDWVKVLCPTWHKVGHLETFFLGSILAYDWIN